MKGQSFARKIAAISVMGIGLLGAGSLSQLAAQPTLPVKKVAVTKSERRAEKSELSGVRRGHGRKWPRLTTAQIKRNATKKRNQRRNKA